MNAKGQILKFIQEKGQARAEDLNQTLNVSRVTIHKQLRKLIEEGLISKSGKAPRVFYQIKSIEDSPEKDIVLDKKVFDFIEKNYIYITPDGRLLSGVEGFKFWCQKTKQPLEKTADGYLKTLNKYYKLRKNGIINGIPKLKNTFKKVGLDKVFYLDFYSIDRFGKTKLGQMLLYSKQSQNRSLMKELIKNIKPQVEKVINKYNITTVGYIPPSVKREVQLMKVLEQNLDLNLRRLNLVKIKTKITVPQKTLNKLEDRIENAKTTVVVDDNQMHKNILLIDDAVGSGSTLNETALQIRQKKICKGKIIGLAITGSYKGFDVISEV